jgi:hypothetical protein
MDAVVLIGGCDKTVPAQLMGAASAGLPAIQLITGSMLTGSHRGETVGACTDCRRFWARFRAEEIEQQEIDDVNNQLVASVGTCSVMGTASTMACIAEALGMTVPGGASPPAVTSARMRVAEETGTVAVQMAKSRLTIAQILTEKAFENAMRVLLAIGGSTNAIVHLTAIAGRLGFEVDLKALDRMGRETPVLLDLKPSGQHYMEHFDAAGGMATLLRELQPLLHLDALTVTGRTLGGELERAAPPFKQDVVRSRDGPIYPQGAPRCCKPGARRRDHQAVRRHPSCWSTRAGPWYSRAARTWRMSTAPTSVSRPGHLAEEHRPQGRAGHARGGLHPAAAQTGAAGREGHGAHLGWPHERHRLRHHRAARDARVGGGRSLRAGAQRRPHPPVGEPARDHPAGVG